MLSKQAIDEYKKIYREEHNKELSEKEALEQAINLLNLFKAIYKPI